MRLSKLSGVKWDTRDTRAYKDTAGNERESYGISEKVAAVVITVKSRHKLMVLQHYARTSRYEDTAMKFPRGCLFRKKQGRHLVLDFDGSLYGKNIRDSRMHKRKTRGGKV